MKKFRIIIILLFLNSILFSTGWQVSKGKFTTGINFNTGNFLTNFKPGINFNIIKYTKSARYAIKEGNIVSVQGKKGGWDWGAEVNHFTGVRVTGFAGVGGNVSFDRVYEKQNKAVEEEAKRSKGIQAVRGAAYGKDLKTKIVKEDGTIAEIPGVAILRQGNEKFGWYHISYDRPNGVNHARELKEVYNLPDAEQSVIDLIIYAVETGDRELQVRMRDGKVQKRWIYTKVIDGKPMKVVVDGPGSPHEGSIITAYPTKYKRDRHRNDNVKYNIPSASKVHNKLKVESFIGAQAGVMAFAGSEVSTNGHIAYTDKNGISYVLSGRGALQGGGFLETRAYAGLRNRQDVVVGACADLFTGVRATGSLTGAIKKGDFSAGITGYGRIGLGLGVRGKAEFKIGWSGISWDVGGEAYVGIGGGVGLKGDINWGRYLDP